MWKHLDPALRMLLKQMRKSLISQKYEVKCSDQEQSCIRVSSDTPEITEYNPGVEG